MNKKKMIGAIIASVCCFALTGCIDSMPDMTEEQQALVAEYAADLILKHSGIYDDGLADSEEMIEETQEETIPEIEPEPETLEETESEPEMVEAEETEEGMETVDMPLADFLGLTDMDIVYEDMLLTDSYPEDESAYFSINVSEGKQMLVLRFDISNLAEAGAECDILSASPQFYVSINDNGRKKAMSTLLLDDLATYKGELAAGEQVTAVVVTEVDGALTEEDIQSVTLEAVVGEEVLKAELF